MEDEKWLLKQALAVKTMEAAAGGKVVSASMSEVINGWVALVIKAADKKLVCVTQGGMSFDSDVGCRKIPVNRMVCMWILCL